MRLCVIKEVLGPFPEGVIRHASRKTIDAHPPVLGVLLNWETG